jgi:DhnA family fructose-bisphosphate aldolase class Ia
VTSGIELRLARLFNGKKNLVISAVDHVTEYGYQPGLEKVGKALAACRTVDAMLLPRVMLERNWAHFAAPDSPVPVFTIGADKLNTDLDVLKKAAASVRAGARGIIFGRNIFMSKHPDRLIEALNEVINDGRTPETAARRHRLA